MTDGIIKGTGNSRFMKSVPNILTLYPTYEAFAEALQNGTFPFDLNGINPAGWETYGMALNKANLLTDALCTALGLPTTATPTQAMDKLRQMANTAQTTANGRAPSITGTYTGDGKVSKSLTFPFEPKLLIVSSGNSNGRIVPGDTRWDGCFIWAKESTETFLSAPGSTAYGKVEFSLSGKKITWTCVSSGSGTSYYPMIALNNSGSSYYYTVFG